jgi:predicted TIM-barrel fold metal-dependent hydrolase
MNIIDAHPHIYSGDRDKYPTIDDPWSPGEPATAEDLKTKMDAAGVAKAVFIQTSTFYGHDNRYVMESTQKHSEWATGVVTLSPDEPKHLDVIEDAVKNYSVRGLRGTTGQHGTLGSPSVKTLWTKARDLGITVNCMVMDDLERVYEIELLARQLPDLNIVIDHCFMLNAFRKSSETLKALERLANLPNVHAKLTSGTHGSARVYPHEDMHGPLKRVIDAFTPQRCVWGSNFPNALWSKGTTYAQNLSLFTDELDLSQSDQEHILSTTAERLWFPQS